MLSFCSQSHVKKQVCLCPSMSCPWMCLMDIVCSLKCSLWEDRAEVTVCIVSPTHKFAYLIEFLSCCNAEGSLSSLWTYWIHDFESALFSLCVTVMVGTMNSHINYFCLNLVLKNRRSAPPLGWLLVMLVHYGSHINEPVFKGWICTFLNFK